MVCGLERSGGNFQSEGNKKDRDSGKKTKPDHSHKERKTFVFWVVNSQFRTRVHRSLTDFYSFVVRYYKWYFTSKAEGVEEKDFSFSFALKILNCGTT